MEYFQWNCCGEWPRADSVWWRWCISAWYTCEFIFHHERKIHASPILFLSNDVLVIVILPTDFSQVHQRGREPAKVQARIGLPWRKDFDGTWLDQHTSFSFPELEIRYHLGISVVWDCVIALSDMRRIWSLFGECPWSRPSCAIFMARVDNDFLIWRNTLVRACFVILYFGSNSCPLRSYRYQAQASSSPTNQSRTCYSSYHCLPLLPHPDWMSCWMACRRRYRQNIYYSFERERQIESGAFDPW